MEAQLVLATLLESQAHLADPRRQGAGTSKKPDSRTPFPGRTPNIPGDTPMEQPAGSTAFGIVLKDLYQHDELENA